MSGIDQLITGKKVLVFGLGLQGGGQGDVRFLLRHNAEVKITDQKSYAQLSTTLANLPADIQGTYGGHTMSDIDWADIILVNPGVPLSIPELVYAAKLGKPLVSRTALFVKYCGIPVIGITGTRGKSTTTELIYRLLDSVFPGQILRGGNIPGVSDLELLDQLAGKKYAVLELSSFQLEHFHASKISPQYAIVTNLYPDHLNRYATMAEYAAAKSAICNYQSSTDITLVNADNLTSAQIVSSASGKIIRYSAKDNPQGNFPHLPGQHNQENMAAVSALAKILQISNDDVVKTFTAYPGLPYRQETRAIISGVTYVNDTTATTPTATLKALDTITTPIILVLGGAEKALPTQELFETIASCAHVRQVIVLGSLFNRVLNTALQTSLAAKFAGRTIKMSEAVALAHSLAKPGDTVLLSPGFASFDLFQNEFDRGNQFNEAVAHIL
ncbi:MAG: UDP-N-acetylmuramoyl-L-alanine--D-glutamate ligase [bacterium]